MPKLASLRHHLGEPIDGSSLVVFRVLFGLLGAFGAARFFWNDWIERFFVRPGFHFHYWGFEGVEVLAPEAMNFAFGALVVLGLMIAVGLFYRLSVVVFFVLFSYVELIDVTYYLNHYYLVSLLAAWLIVLPLGSEGSLDALWQKKLGWKRPVLRRWMLWALRLQVGIVYFHAGMAKFTTDWLLHAQPLGIWLASRTDTPIFGPLFAEPWVAYAMSWAGFLYDTTIPFWLSWRRTRPYAFLVLLFFHGMTHILFLIGLFPLIMTCAATLFFEPNWPRRLWYRFRPTTPKDVASPGEASPLALPVLTLLGAALVVQALLPLRAHAYGGNVLWHEQGMRWSWRVMCREKAGSVTYRVLWDGRTREMHVSPSSYLTPYQEREMSGQPDLILQLAQHIGAQHTARGRQNVQVRVDALVSLNGRIPQPLIDPEVDLMQVEDSIAPASWIAPAPPGEPIRLRRMARGQ